MNGRLIWILLLVFGALNLLVALVPPYSGANVFNLLAAITCFVLAWSGT